ncbi:MAG: hypothetical protein U1E29_02135 [Coriobacteriia bacterium]|nr:hypothetical protein [Coriobacteriia bacterium]
MVEVERTWGLTIPALQADAAGLKPWKLSGRGYVRVVTDDHQRALGQSVGGLFTPDHDTAVHIPIVAFLVPEQRGRFSKRTAVRVDGPAGTIGYLESHLSETYAHPIRHLVESGFYAWTFAHVQGESGAAYPKEYRKGLEFSREAVLELGPPHVVIPRNGVSAGHQLVRTGQKSYSVKVESQDVLARYMEPRLVDASLFAMLSPLDKATKTGSPLLGVWIDGTLVGSLSAATSKKLYPLVAAFGESDRWPYVEVEVSTDEMGPRCSVLMSSHPYELMRVE